MKENKSREMYEEINNLTKSFQPRLGVIKDCNKMPFFSGCILAWGTFLTSAGE